MKGSSSSGTNFGRMFPMSPPPFRIDSTFRQHIKSSGSNLFRTSEIHQERMKRNEKLLGAAVSDCAKKFIGTTSSDIWSSSNNGFGLSIQQKPIIKPILKIPNPKTKINPPPKYLFHGESMARSLPSFRKRGGLNSSGDDNDNDTTARHHQVTFGGASYDDLHKKENDGITIKKLEKVPGISQIRLQSPPLHNTKYSKFGKKPSSELIKVINGQAYLATDEDRYTPNTFADSTNIGGLYKTIGESIIRDKFYKEINLEGFWDNEICFQTDDSSLVITAERPKRDGLNARKVCEVIEFPEGIYHETLLISRNKKGIITVQEHHI